MTDDRLDVPHTGEPVVSTPWGDCSATYRIAFYEGPRGERGYPVIYSVRTGKGSAKAVAMATSRLRKVRPDFRLWDVEIETAEYGGGGDHDTLIDHAEEA